MVELAQLTAEAWELIATLLGLQLLVLLCVLILQFIGLIRLWRPIRTPPPASIKLTITPPDS